MQGDVRQLECLVVQPVEVLVARMVARVRGGEDPVGRAVEDRGRRGAARRGGEGRTLGAARAARATAGVSMVVCELVESWSGEEGKSEGEEGQPRRRPDDLANRARPELGHSVLARRRSPVRSRLPACS